MKRLLSPRAWTLVLVLLASVLADASAQLLLSSPQPGDVYREYSRVMQGDDWRVTDPNMSLSQYPQAAPYLPNPVVYINIDDLQGAIRAEAVINMWGGHVGTTGKKIMFNGNGWIDIPEMNTANGIPPGGDGFNYIQQLDCVIPIPLGHLVQGGNSFTGTNSGQSGPYGFGWGQFGWYSIIIRIYYNSSKPHSTGTVTSPASDATFGENPVVSANVSAETDRVDFLAYYDGVDTDGDGVWQEYHHDYAPHSSESQPVIKNHVGTATGAPWQVTWNTHYVPDQLPGSVKILARIRNANGVWYVSPEATNLTLRRTNTTVRLYKPLDTPERAWARESAPINIHVNIPGTDNVANAQEVAGFVRTWNGIDSQKEPSDYSYRKFNNYTDNAYGGDHVYSMDIRSYPTSDLQTGTNTFTFFSTNVAHHGIEILWPGPALVVTYSGATVPLPGAPSLVSPANNAANQLTSLTLEWSAAAAADSYTLQLSTDSTFATTIINETGITATSRSVGPLANLTRFFWRVRGKNTTGDGPWSEVWAFNTSVSAPVLIAPADNAVGVPISTTLTWHTTQSATAYRVQVATSNAFGAPLVKDTTLADTTLAVSGLAYSTQYFWRVAAQVGGQFTPYSGSRMFTTAFAPAGAPVLLSPANNSTGQSLNPTLLWRKGANATSYHLQFGTDSTFASGRIINDSTLTDTSKGVTSLAYDKKYFWRVRSKNAGGYSAFGTVWNFRTVTAVPNAPALVAPAQNAIGQPTINLTFRWRTLAGATKYVFQLATDSTFAAGIVKNDTSVTDTFRTVSGLLDGTRYFWRVGGKNANGAGPFSSAWGFTSAIPVPGTVVLSSPVNQAIVTADSARFVWRKTDPASVRYWFEVSADSAFSGFSAIDSMVTDTTKVMKPLVNNLTYFWRVRGANAGGWGTFSETRRFRVIITSVESDQRIPTEYVLGQNYPNPFNPGTQITFGVPRESHVALEVFNLLGERVALLADEVRAPGQYVVQFNASEIPSGVYLYRMTAGDVILYKKMLLLK